MSKPTEAELEFTVWCADLGGSTEDVEPAEKAMWIQGYEVAAMQATARINFEVNKIKLSFPKKQFKEAHGLIDAITKTTMSGNYMALMVKKMVKYMEKYSDKTPKV